MHKKTTLLASIIVAVTVLSGLSTFAAGVSLPKREEAVKMTGFGNSGTNMNPWTGNPGLGVQLMYMPFGGWNFVTEKYIPALATNVTFDATGLIVNVKLNEEAKWSDGKAITAEDAIFSIETAYKTTRFADMKTRISKIEEVSTSEFKMTLAAEYKNSLNVLKWFTNDLFVVPKSVWEPMVNANTSVNPDLIDNNWFDDDFPSKDKVSSGPYRPYYLSDTEDLEIYKKVSGWWGDDALYQDLPSIKNNVEGDAPEYISSLPKLSNILKDAALVTGEIDVHSGAVSGIARLVGDSDNIRTWYNDSESQFYLPGGGVIGVAFNYKNNATDKQWLKDSDLHHALGWAIDYDHVNDYGNDGNWIKARPGLVDDRVPTLAKYYDAAVTAKYEKVYNASKAMELLIDAGYVFNQTRYDNLMDLATATEDLEIDKVESAWSDASGNEVKFTIQSQTNWGDVNRATESWCESWREIGIPTEHYHLNFDDTGYKATMLSTDPQAWEVTMNCMGPQMGNDIMTVLEGYQGDFGNTVYNQNITGWTSEIYRNNFTSFESADEATQKALAASMQEEFANKTPFIPVMINALWLTYNVDYWSGFTMEVNKYQQACSAATTSQVAIKQRWLLNLRSTGKKPGIPFTGIGFAVGAAFVAVSLLTVKKIRKDL